MFSHGSQGDDNQVQTAWALQIVGTVQRPTLPTELLGAAIAFWGLALPLRVKVMSPVGKLSHQASDQSVSFWLLLQESQCFLLDIPTWEKYGQRAYDSGTIVSSRTVEHLSSH